MLVDGVAAAAWTVKKTRGEATLVVRTFRPLSAADRDAMGAEGLDLPAFLEPGAAHDVRLDAVR